MKATLKNTVVVLILAVTALNCQIKKDTSAVLSELFAKASDNTRSDKERIDYNKKALALILQSEHQQGSLFFKNLFQVSNIYYELKALEDYKTTTERIEKKAQELQNDATLAKSYHNIGNYYIQKNIPDSAYFYYSKAEKLYTLVDDKEHIGKTILNKASLQYHDGDFARAETSCFNALRYFKTLSHKVCKLKS